MKFWPKHYLVRGFVDCCCRHSLCRCRLSSPPMKHTVQRYDAPWWWNINQVLSHKSAIIWTRTVVWSSNEMPHWPDTDFVTAQHFVQSKGTTTEKKIWEYSSHFNLSNALSNSLRGIDAVILQRKQVKGHPENNKKMLPKSGSGIHLRNRELFI